MCTKNGAGVWLFLYVTFSSLLLFELVALQQVWITQPELETGLGLTGAVAVFGAAAGIELLRQGLTNAGFAMPMRIALVSLGAVVAGGALLFGASPLAHLG